TPAKFLVFRATGDLRRPTFVLSFDTLLRNLRESIIPDIQRSVWLARTSSARFYCSLVRKVHYANAWAYDTQCMFPANDAALNVRDRIEPLLLSEIGERIDWRIGLAVVIDNWKVLHARGPMPFQECSRTLQRIYVGVG